MTQAQKILNHLQNGNSITAIDALNNFGCFRLAARISDLKKDGWDIKSEPWTTPGGATIAKYTLPLYAKHKGKEKVEDFKLELDGYDDLTGFCWN
tara:strand:- start:190 stop:474 length:285 start_codon:yes stop_codon:yes gene_type:complete